MFSGLRACVNLGKQFVVKSILGEKRIDRGERGNGRELKVQCGLQQVTRGRC